MPSGSLSPLDEVIDYLLSRAKCLVATETVGLAEARDRILASDVVSTTDVPLMDNSAMDGYAVNNEGLSRGVLLPVSDRIPAGSVGPKPRTSARFV